MDARWLKSLQEIREPLVTRFAPSPTGYLHLGHAFALLYVHAVAEVFGAQVLLRIEDHDRQRCRPEYEQAILDDIAWLGLYPDNWTQITSSSSSYRQRTRYARYDAISQQLRKQEKAYYCSCSRKQLMQQQPLHHPELYYSGFCRDRGLLLAPDTGLRWQIAPQTVDWIDALYGKQQQNPAEECGDLLIQDRHGNFTYNFCVVVDDLDQGVNLVVRGTDLLHCTGRQILLAKEIGACRPTHFLHHPLLTDSQQRKLSKRSLSKGLIQRRLAGETPRQVFGEALFLAGLTEFYQPFTSIESVSLLKTNF